MSTAQMAPLADYQVRDVAFIRSRFPVQAGGLTDGGIAAAYSWWSEEIHCAGWLMMDAFTADDFAAYAFDGVPTLTYSEWEEIHEATP